MDGQTRPRKKQQKKQTNKQKHAHTHQSVSQNKVEAALYYYDSIDRVPREEIFLSPTGYFAEYDLDVTSSVLAFLLKI